VIRSSVHCFIYRKKINYNKIILLFANYRNCKYKFSDSRTKKNMVWEEIAQKMNNEGVTISLALK